MYKPWSAVAVGLALCGLILSGCSGKDDDAISAADEGLPAVSGKVGEAPRIEAGKGNPPSELTKRILAKGDGAEIRATDFLVVDYVGQLWDGQPFDSTFERNTPAGFPVKGVVKGWEVGLTGVHVGDRVQLTMPPELGFGEKGNPPKVPANSTLVFVADVIRKVDTTDLSALAKASVTKRTLPEAKVEGNLAEAPSIMQTPDAVAPSEIVVQVLAEGPGEPVGPDDYVIYHSSVKVWGDDKQGSSYDEGGMGATGTSTILNLQPEQVKRALLGQKVGSRVLLLTPAEAENKHSEQSATPAYIKVIDIVAKVSGKAQ